MPKKNVQHNQYVKKQKKEKYLIQKELLLMNRINNNEPLFYESPGLPKRNEKCFCGSGKKFKKCCYLVYKIPDFIINDNFDIDEEIEKLEQNF